MLYMPIEWFPTKFTHVSICILLQVGNISTALYFTVADCDNDIDIAIKLTCSDLIDTIRETLVGEKHFLALLKQKNQSLFSR